MACAAGRAREAEFVRKECDARQDNREDAAEVGDDPRARVDAVTEPNSHPIDQLRAVRVRRIAPAHFYVTRLPRLVMDWVESQGTPVRFSRGGLRVTNRVRYCWQSVSPLEDRSSEVGASAIALGLRLQ